ncbi:MAG: bifunctional phosphopantothenoylcysteine decarboxylase/phosphopantothenate--cysteine ligase CoaBC [Clostridiales bacterium]|nr:bifunctional phosphopantothenoylcysteine decarboxylase/phosphopantothenate--cysteine ligase CoaBC [Clostridiales bacterium]
MTEPRVTVVLGVTGCIAAYKACEIVRALTSSGVRVKAVMTEAAAKFLGPLTLRTLTGEPVTTSLWDEPTAGRVFHVSLAEEAGVFVIAPCTANVIAKLAHGIADDMLTTTALATEAPLVIAPAMNTHMWRDEATRANLAVLRERGAVIVAPSAGELACGDVGEGRLAAVSDITDAILAEVVRVRDLDGVRLLVTAGPTYEPIDAVRFIGNRSSGKTGYHIAEEASRRGGEVTLVSGPTSLPDPFGVRTVRVETAAEMYEEAMAAFAVADAVIATAAVADARPVHVASGKLKKHEVAGSLELERTVDILAAMGESKGERVLVGFAAESGDLIGSARDKLVRKRLDLVVANDITLEGLGFASERNTVTLVSAEGVEEVPEMAKRLLAKVICDRLSALVAGGRATRSSRAQQEGATS